jgi:hypothetical protein
MQASVARMFEKANANFLLKLHLRSFLFRITDVWIEKACSMVWGMVGNSFCLALSSRRNNRSSRRSESSLQRPDSGFPASRG